MMLYVISIAIVDSATETVDNVDSSVAIVKYDEKANTTPAAKWCKNIIKTLLKLSTIGAHKKIKSLSKKRIK